MSQEDFTELETSIFGEVWGFGELPNTTDCREYAASWQERVQTLGLDMGFNIEADLSGFNAACGPIRHTDPHFLPLRSLLSKYPRVSNEKGAVLHGMAEISNRLEGKHKGSAFYIKGDLDELEFFVADLETLLSPEEW